MSTPDTKKIYGILYGGYSLTISNYLSLNEDYYLLMKRVSSRVFIIFFEKPYRKIKYWCIKEREEKFEQIWVDYQDTQGS